MEDEVRKTNPDLWLVAVIAAAHTLGKAVYAVRDRALDARGETEPLLPLQMEEEIRAAGVSATLYADATPHPSELFWQAARCGRWVISWVTCPCTCGNGSWVLLDACWDHEPRALWFPQAGKEPVTMPAGELEWRGQHIVLGRGKLPNGHGDTGMPSPN